MRSRRLTAERREELSEEICKFPRRFASPCVESIDNILGARRRWRAPWCAARCQGIFVDGRDKVDAPCDRDA
jgi:ribonuclease HII